MTHNLLCEQYDNEGNVKVRIPLQSYVKLSWSDDDLTGNDTLHFSWGLLTSRAEQYPFRMEL